MAEFSYLSLLCLQPCVYTLLLFISSARVSARRMPRAVTHRPPAKTEASPTAAAAWRLISFLAPHESNVTLWRHLWNQRRVQTISSHSNCRSKNELLHVLKSSDQTQSPQHQMWIHPPQKVAPNKCTIFSCLFEQQITEASHQFFLVELSVVVAINDYIFGIKHLL